MPCASSWIAASTISATERLWPRCTTSTPGGLQHPAHEVDRRVVAVEQARGGDEAQACGAADGRRRLVPGRLPEIGRGSGHGSAPEAADS